MQQERRATHPYKRSVTELDTMMEGLREDETISQCIKACRATRHGGV
jgi:hypothetical protein